MLKDAHIKLHQRRDLASLLGVIGLLISCMSVSLGATLTVNSTGDASDNSPGDGACDTSVIISDVPIGPVFVPPCTLRAAIEQANALGAGPHSINFSIEGCGGIGQAACLIQPASELPSLTASISINGSFGGPRTILNGSVMANPSPGNGANGLTIAVSSCAIRNVEILGFKGNNNFGTVRGNGIWIQAGSNNIVAGNVIHGNGGDGIYINSSANRIGGTTAADGNDIYENSFTGVSMTGSGTSGNKLEGNRIGGLFAGDGRGGNGAFGVYVNGAPGNTVGGTAPGAGNVISGNQGAGVRVNGAGATDNVVLGNHIGTDVTGSTAVANKSDGVSIGGNSSRTRVGGTSPAERNIISGNAAVGVVMVNTTHNIVQGNLIGTDNGGTQNLGNGGTGVRVTAGSDNQIGGAIAGAGNVIAFNQGNGVTIASEGGPALRNSILENSISSNGLLGIDLGNPGPDGVTANDAGDGDSGANNLQNYPNLTSAIASGSSTALAGTLNSTASAAFTLEFFSSPTCDNSGFGEGKIFLNSKSATTDSAGNASFNVALPFVQPGQFITATVTDASGNTSEFSKCDAVVSPGLVSLSSSLNPSELGQSVTFTAKVGTAQGRPVPTGTVTFRDAAATLATVALDNSGKASFATASLAIGNHSITAAYGGDANYAAGATLNPTAQVVTKCATTASVTSDTNPIDVGQTTNLITTVSGRCVPTGGVTFKDGRNTLGTGTLASGKATLAASFTTAGNHQITAEYAGDASNLASTSLAIVEGVGPGATATSVSSSVNPATAGDTVTLAATVNTVGGQIPTGSVTFTEGTTTLGVASLSAGAANLSLAAGTLSAGTHNITANYSGDANNHPSIGSLTQVVNLATTSVSLTISPDNPSNNQPVTLTAKVTGVAPSGRVSFKDGDTVIGTADLQSDGTAKLTLPALTLGARSLTAEYSSDANNAPSTSAPVGQIVSNAEAGSPAAGCTVSSRPGTFDPTLLAMASLAVVWLRFRRKATQYARLQ